MFNESLSFAMSAATATIVAKAGTGALAFLIVATPVGWVGLIVGGAIVIGAAATTIVVNDQVKKHSDGIYTTIMKKIDSLLWM